jgi:predicted transcriptional regulator
MKAVTIKLSDACASRVSRLARARKTSKSNVIREALERGLANEDPLDDVRDLIGLAEGPVDLARNREHMRGYGQG